MSNEQCVAELKAEVSHLRRDNNLLKADLAGAIKGLLEVRSLCAGTSELSIIEAVAGETLAAIGEANC